MGWRYKLGDVAQYQCDRSERHSNTHPDRYSYAYSYAYSYSDSYTDPKPDTDPYAYSGSNSIRKSQCG
jgi:hypothetical protein